ncbi:MAG: SDR family NAD(P)-dependent oxidoreductase [Acidimicrobiia bacterium]|nr:SDR family NAD(P)-dependent oxidoreductase [Acidimicrobiia bacterium]
MDTSHPRLSGKTAIVAGGTRGVSLGIARELAISGAAVFLTGRSATEGQDSPGGVTAVRCDHRDDAAVDAVFARVLVTCRLSSNQSSLENDAGGTG